ncbi:Zinc finger protein [Dirofilaria immitis]
MPKKHTSSNKARKRKGNDMDQIIEEIRSGKRQCLASRQIDLDLDLPGGGQFYCIECTRCFIDEKSLSSHRSSKVHRQRLKRLGELPYTQREAEESVGLKTSMYATWSPISFRLLLILVRTNLSAYAHCPQQSTW